MPPDSRREELARYLEGSSKPVAVSDLATHLGVTVRTVLRDVEELRARGYEIVGARGRGGGLRLVAREDDTPELVLADRRTEPDAGQARQRRRPVFVGREAELRALLDAFGEVRAGAGRVVMLAGEPGIGKTGVVQQLSDRIGGDAAQLYWGRCYESEGALPYWPWLQVINAYASATATDLLREEMGEGASDIAEMAPDLHVTLSGLERPTMSDTPEAARFRLFRSIAQFVSRAAEKSPLVLILEDLHWADRPSLLLLEFLAGELADSPVLLIGTYRDVELNRRHPLAQTLAELNRQQHFLRMTLRGLEEEEVGRIVALASGQKPSPELVVSLHRQTEGNPLFVTEMVSLLREEGGFSNGEARADVLLSERIPEGVREAIGRRLDRLSNAANTVLRVASVMGREFTIQEARRLRAGLPEMIPDSGVGLDVEILPALEEALRAGIIERNVRELASYQFTHSMIRDTLYDELTTPERVGLHRLAGEAIETIHGAHLDPHLSGLAHHFLEAAQAGNPDRAVHYAERAGDRTVEMVAFEEGSRLYGMALQALQLCPSGQMTGNDVS
ncbi:MAG: AAA family ATPase [Dehalococcoidia bacterium]|nr:AAA family ATPase [Dehalococcoidia bacterium]